jgi:adenylate kinase
MREVALLLGRQGSGKGTVGRIVDRGAPLRFLSAGELLRAEARGGTERGRRIEVALSNGDQVAPEESYPLIGQAIERMGEGGLLLDGCPRRRNEVALVKRMLGGEPALVIELYLPLPLALARMLVRVTCRECEAPYGPKVQPAEGGRCTECGGVVEQRADDTFERMSRRLSVWDVEGRRIIRYYEGATTVARIDATRAPDVVAAEVRDHLYAALGAG